MEDKKQVLTKDGRKLSDKQINVLDYKYYDVDEFIETHTYKECFDEIGKIIKNWETHPLDMGDDMPYGMEDLCMMDGW